MTAHEFEALLNTLPNGLHDAELVSLAIDLGQAEVDCAVLADLSDPDDPSSEGRHRPVRLHFTGVSFVALDPPELEVAALGHAWIDAGGGHAATSPRPAPPAPDDGFLAWIFLQETNGFICLGARHASIEG
jgi:hypothetical protein